MGKSAKFFKRPTRKEKAVIALSKGGSESLYDEATANSASAGSKKKDALSQTANPTIGKKSKGADQPSKSSLALKMQMNGGVKQAIKDLRDLDRTISEDEDMGDVPQQQNQSKKQQQEDKSRPRPDYVELMYGKPQSGKRKSFQPKPMLIKMTIKGPWNPLEGCEADWTPCFEESALRMIPFAMIAIAGTARFAHLSSQPVLAHLPKDARQITKMVGFKVHDALHLTHRGDEENWSKEKKK
ncbi:hypothetical protein BGZ73_004231 [Actinomortierella ambigua]|nr:hypothetical protein BGZ73_004231 [Actinomortierella ambigua]